MLVWFIEDDTGRLTVGLSSSGIPIAAEDWQSAFWFVRRRDAERFCVYAEDVFGRKLHTVEHEVDFPDER